LTGEILKHKKNLKTGKYIRTIFMTKYIVTFRVSVLSRGQYWSESTKHQGFSVTKKQMPVIYNHIFSMTIIILQTKIFGCQQKSQHVRIICRSLDP